MERANYLQYLLHRVHSKPDHQNEQHVDYLPCFVLGLNSLFGECPEKTMVDDENGMAGNCQTGEASIGEVCLEWCLGDDVTRKYMVHDITYIWRNVLQ